MAILRLARKRLEISFEMKTCLVVKLFPSPIDNLVKRFCFQKHSRVWFTCFVRCVNQAVKQWDMRYSFSIHPFMYLLYLLSHYSTIMYFWHCLKLWHVAFLTTYNSVWLFLVVCSCRHLVIYANSSTLSFLFCIFLHVLVIKNLVYRCILWMVIFYSARQNKANLSTQSKTAWIHTDQISVYLTETHNNFKRLYNLNFSL